MFCYQWDLFGETSAAWVQAIGTLAALGLAIWAPIWHAKTAERQATIEQLQLFLALATEITSRCDQIFNSLDDNSETGRLLLSQLKPDQLQEIADRCHKVDFTILRDYRMLPFVSNLPGQVKPVVSELHSVSMSAGRINELRDHVKSAKLKYEHVTRTIGGLTALLAEYQQP